MQLYAEYIKDKVLTEYNVQREVLGQPKAQRLSRQVSILIDVLSEEINSSFEHRPDSQDE